MRNESYKTLSVAEYPIHGNYVPHGEGTLY